MHYQDVRGLLSAKNGMNLYRGCTHGCIYCDSRSKCYQMNHDFEDVEVKRNAPELLENALRRKRSRCMIGTGSMCDPYLPLEKRERLTGYAPAKSSADWEKAPPRARPANTGRFQ